MSKKIYTLIILVSLTLTLLLLKHKITQIRQLSLQAVNTSAPTILSNYLSNYQQSLKSGKIKPIKSIAQIDIIYTKDNSNPFSVQKFTKKNGYPPKSFAGDYIFNLIDNSGNSLYSLKFVLPDKIISPPADSIETSLDVRRELTNITFSLTFPWFDKATNFSITNIKGQKITSGSLPQPNVISNTPNFSLINHQSLLNLQTPLSLTEEPLNVAIIGDKFTSSELQKYHLNVETIVSQFYNTSPFKERASHINFYIVDNTTIDLGCNHWWATDPTDPYFRLVGCLKYINGAWTNQHVIDTVNNSGVPWDKIFVLVDDPYYGGSGQGIDGFIATSTNMDGTVGDANRMEELMLHEFSHGLGVLDEYNYGTQIPPSELPQIVNCSSVNPNPNWVGFAGSQDYKLICSSTDWYRSSEKSIMFHLSYKYFNAPSIITIHNFLNNYVSPVRPSDPLNSTIYFNIPFNNPYYSPSAVDGCTEYIYNQANLHLTISNPSNISYIKLFVDNVYLKTYYPDQNKLNFNSSQVLSFDTTTLTNGNHTFKLYGNNGIGAQTESNQIYIYVLNGITTKTGSYPRNIYFKLIPKCPNGYLPSNQVISNYSLFPPTPVKTLPSTYQKNGYYSIVTDSCNNNIYVRLMGNGTPLKPINPPSPFTGATYFNPPQWAAKASRLNLHNSLYTIYFEAPQSWCPSPTSTPTPNTCPVSCGSQYDGYWCCEAGEICGQYYPDCIRF